MVVHGLPPTLPSSEGVGNAAQGRGAWGQDGPPRHQRGGARSCSGTGSPSFKFISSFPR